MTDAPETVPPPDDQEIPGDWVVLRRIPPDGFKDTGRPKSSPNFDLDRTGRGTSVTIWAGDEDIENVLRGHDGYGLVSLTVQAWRDQGLTIARKIVDGDPNHCEVWGQRNTKAKRALAKIATWQVHPDGFPDHLKGQPAVEGE